MVRYVRWICAVLLFILSKGILLAQPYRQLTARDFTGAVPQGSGFYVAHTSCDVSMRYNVSKYQSNYRLTFDVRLRFNPERSWINRQMVTNPDMMAEVLRHEQGHYQIAYLMQQEMISALNQYRYTGDYQRQTDDIFKRIDDKYRQMNADYDEDTQHMQNRKQQAAWINYINNELVRTGSLVMNK